MGVGFSISHAADLAAQLPRDARLWRAIDPAMGWSDETWLLARIDHSLRVMAWAQGGGKGECPQMVTPVPKQKQERKGRTPEEVMELLGRKRHG